MTIGSSYNHPANIATTLPSPSNPWAARFPNPPDLCFDYRKLVEQTGGIAKANLTNHRICIVGAGVTGLTAARELLRCGFAQITVIEQSKRVGGRHLTVVNNPRSSSPSTPFEMGAMRMPFFNRTGEAPKDGCSLMAYYAKLFELRISDFPNPGTPWVASTGIYLQEGELEGQGEPRMLIWNNPDGSTLPPAAVLQQVYAKWHRFATRMTEHVAAVYGSEHWEAQWAAIVAHYHVLSFRDLVRLPALDSWDADAPGDFGGLGMSAEESAIFYAIGIGDGSWGAFYDVCCLYPLRTAIFGFSSHLQLVHGRVDEQGIPLPAPYLGDTVYDSKGLRFAPPNYLGLAALDECLLFMEISELGKSLYSHLLQHQDGLLTDSSVCALSKLPNGKVRVRYQWNVSNPDKTTPLSADFDAVIVTLPSWLIETNVHLEHFTSTMLPSSIINAYKTAHWETSCKVYAPLKKSFLRRNRRIPQILVTDSFVHDVYAYRYNDSYAYDCILLSYTWEDDATKLASLSDTELTKRCVTELDRILLRCTNIGEPISPYVDTDNARVQRWVTDKNALGCAKLYRAGTYYDAISLMKYNRDLAEHSGLYLVGESFSVDAGWTEPCFRTAVDAVINICRKTGASFNGGFSMDDYPHYQVQV
ncbi:FAD-dependent oxidoreductase [Pseudomonas sp. GD03860]|uniref:flavin monoamine oxidase family protein n=1 Tax=Pseudomonas TaxID=286 RepID=UPI0023640D76|nr:MULTISPECIES: FAD-dependent oxidoreductase [Pseudomonas]MDD2057862.1 FAD-dependent oxidoreductase [Pseudomonas putida]MDH0638412.1 FAD-dependent oxidoreductase [Pseudomonas sp. GD03860]